MTQKEETKQARQLKQEMAKRRTNPKGSIKDIAVMLRDAKRGDYTKSHETRLYREYPSEYCEYLEIIARS